MEGSLLAAIILIAVSVIILVIFLIFFANMKPPPLQDTCIENGQVTEDLPITHQSVCETKPEEVELYNVSWPALLSDSQAEQQIILLTSEGVGVSDFGRLKPDAHGIPLKINTAISDPRGNLYIHVQNETMSGIYRLDRIIADNIEGRNNITPWQYISSTGSSLYGNSKHDLRKRFDMKTLNSVVSLFYNSKEKDEVVFKTFQGNYGLDGTLSELDESILFKNGKYSINSEGKLIMGDYEVDLPQGVTIDVGTPVQISDLTMTHNSLQYAFIANRDGKRGVVIVYDGGNFFMPADVNSFSIVDRSIIYISSSGEGFLKELGSEISVKLGDFGENAFIVGGGNICYVIKGQ